jgi:hypothetical protein
LQLISVAGATSVDIFKTDNHMKLPYCRQTAPYSPELEPDIVLTQPHASGVNETCTPLVIAEGGSIPLHWMAELIAFSTWVS